MLEVRKSAVPDLEVSPGETAKLLPFAMLLRWEPALNAFAITFEGSH